MRRTGKTLDEIAKEAKRVPLNLALLPNARITEKQIAEFTALYKTGFRKSISTFDAAKMIQRVTRLYQIIYRRLPGETSNVRKVDVGT